MVPSVSDVELVHHLDQLLWREELQELHVASDVLDGLRISTGIHADPLLLDFIITSLPSVCPESSSAYTLLLGLVGLTLGLKDATVGVRSLSTGVRKGFELLEPNRREHNVFVILLNNIGEILSHQVMCESKSADVSVISSTLSLSFISENSVLTEENFATMRNSIAAAYLRHTFNLVSILCVLHRHDPVTLFRLLLPKEQLFPLLVRCITSVEKSVIPVRKVVMVLFQLTQIDSHNVPWNRWLYPRENSSALGVHSGDTTSSSQLLLAVATRSEKNDAFKYPYVKDFRQFEDLGAHLGHLQTLVHSCSSSAVKQGAELVEQLLGEFACRHEFSKEEQKKIDAQPILKHILVNFVINKTPLTPLKNATPPNPPSHPFALPQLARSLVANYQILSEESDSNAAPSGDPQIPYLPLVHEAYDSCSSWMSCSDSEQSAEELIEAIAEAAVPPGSPEGLSVVKKEGGIGKDEPPGTECFSWDIQEVIVILLRSLLTTSRRGEENGGFSHINSDLEHLRNLLTKFVDMGTISHTDESKRQITKNLDIIASLICGVLILMLKQGTFRSREAREAFEQTIADNNGCLVLIKLITNAPEDGTDIVLTDATPSIFPVLDGNLSWKRATPAVHTVTVFRAMELLYWITRKSPRRIKKFLVHYKLPVILKRFFRAPNLDIQRIAYRLFKIQMRYMSKHWKMIHMKLFSNCYCITSTDVIDDWITSDFVDGDTLSSATSPTESQPDSKRNEVSVDEYAHLILSGNINFENPAEVERFCKRTGEKPASFFFGYKSFEDYILRGIGL